MKFFSPSVVNRYPLNECSLWNFQLRKISIAVSHLSCFNAGGLRDLYVRYIRVRDEILFCNYSKYNKNAVCSALNELTRCERIDSYFPTDDDVQNYYNHYSVLRTRHTSIYCEFHYQPKVIKISFLFFKPRIPTTYMYYIIMFINNRSFANMFCSENVLFIHFGICWKEEFIGTIFLRTKDCQNRMAWNWP